MPSAALPSAALTYAALTSNPIGDEDSVFGSVDGLLVNRWGGIDLFVSCGGRSVFPFRHNSSLDGNPGAGGL